MASRFVLPNADVGNGIQPEDGAKLTFLESGTGTLKATFSNKAGTIPNTNPVIADANGVFPDIFIVGTYKVILTDKNNVQTGFGEADPVDEFATAVELTAKDFIASKTLAEATGDTLAVAGDTVIISNKGESIYRYETGKTANIIDIFAAVGSLFVVKQYRDLTFATVDDLLKSTFAGVKADVRYFDTSNKIGSGALWRRDGTTGTASTTDFINGKVFNADGDGYTIEPRNGVLSPVQLGAIGDGTTDDTTSLNNFFSFVASAKFDVDGLEYVHFTQAISATYEGIVARLRLKAASVQEFLIRFTLTGDILVINCEFDGNSIAAKTLYFLNDSTSLEPDVLVENNNIHDFHQSPSTGQAAGIQAQGRMNINIDKSNLLNGTSSKTPSLVRGITFEPSGVSNQSPRIVKVLNNNITNITAVADADGINYTLPISGDVKEYSLLIQGNRFKNCEKRSVKSQVRNTIVDDNMFFYDATPVDRFAEVEFQRGGGICTNNRFFNESTTVTGFRYVSISDDDTLIENNASIIAHNTIISENGDEFVFSIITDDQTTPTRKLAGCKIDHNTYIGTCQYFCQLNPVAHGAGTATTVIDNLEVSSNQMTLVTGALLWHGRRSGPSVSSRVRLSVHDNMHGDADTVDIPLEFDNTSNLSIIYIKDADNEGFLAGT